LIRDLATKGIGPDENGVFPALKIELREIYD